MLGAESNTHWAGSIDAAKKCEHDAIERARVASAGEGGICTLAGNINYMLSSLNVAARAAGAKEIAIGLQSVETVQGKYGSILTCHVTVIYDTGQRAFGTHFLIPAPKELIPAWEPDPAPPAPTPERVPLTPAAGGFDVDATINGVLTLTLAIDSGAATVLLPADTLKALWRAGTLTQADAAGSITYATADGAIVPSSLYILHSVKIGNVELHDVKVGVGPMALLGQSFLSRLRSWSIDNAHGELEMVP
jgi:clan AA aspartic protease (TIGR02281 family)